jgi:hypothetical protein
VALRRAALAAIVGSLGACAPASPLLSGASTTPTDRVDLGVGAAARVPLGELTGAASTDSESALLVADAPGGVVPVAVARVGPNESWDAGIVVAGLWSRIDLRAALPLDPASSVSPEIVFGIGPSVGLVRGDGAEGTRLGVELPVLLTIDASSVLELWVGPRVSVEHVFGRVPVASTNMDASALVVRAGGIVGLAVGFRHLHALVELTASWERWDAEVGAEEVGRSGVALGPAFAIRYRL